MFSCSMVVVPFRYYQIGWPAIAYYALVRLAVQQEKHNCVLLRDETTRRLSLMAYFNTISLVHLKDLNIEG